MLILRSISQPCGYAWLQALGSKIQFHLPLKSQSFRHFHSAPAQFRANLLPSGATNRRSSSSKKKPDVITRLVSWASSIYLQLPLYLSLQLFVTKDRLKVEDDSTATILDWKRAEKVIEGVIPEKHSSADYNPRRKWSESEVSLSFLALILSLSFLYNCTILHLTLQADLLRQLIKEQAFAPSISWISIAKELHRSPAQCQSKWKTLQYKPQGPFTTEEDALILRTVENWEQAKGKGLWTSLGTQLQRDHRIVRSRYRALLVPESEHKKKKAIIRWNDEMVSIGYWLYVLSAAVYTWFLANTSRHCFIYVFFCNLH